MTQTWSKADLFTCRQSEVNDSPHPRIDVGENDNADDGAERDQNAVDDVVVGRGRRGRRAERTETKDGHQDESDDETA